MMLTYNWSSSIQSGSFIIDPGMKYCFDLKILRVSSHKKKDCILGKYELKYPNIFFLNIPSYIVIITLETQINILSTNLSSRFY